jgi:hypothetical protein
MNIVSFIETSLQIHLIGKKLKDNNSIIISVSLEDAGNPYHYEYKIFIYTKNGDIFVYRINEDIELAEG